MPTIIDSLLVTLGLDSKKFNQGVAQVDKGLKATGKEAEATGKKLEGAGKQGAAGFNEATDGLSKFLAKLGGLYVLKKVVIDTVQTNAELYRFSRNLKESARDISAFGNAVEITGGDARAFQGTLSMLSRSQTELQMTGQSGLLPYFSRFNVAMMDVNGNARKGTDILLDFADRMAGMDRTTAFNTMQAMGVDAGTANAMLEGRQGLQKLIDAQKEHGAVTDKQAERAEASRRSLTESKITANALKNELVDGLNPALKTALDLFNRLDAVTGGWSTALVGLVASLGAVRAALGATAAIAGGGATGGAAGGLLLRLAGFLKGTVGLSALLYSGDLNTGEEAELAARRAKGFSLPPTGAGAGRGSQGVGSATDPQAFFESKGWSKAQAAGIVANLRSESAMNPGASGDGGSAFGIAQWHPDRQAAFKAWAGKDIRGSSLAEQLAFVHFELSAGGEQRAGAALRGVGSASDAAAIVSRMYERPKDAEGEASRRARLAMLMMGQPGASGLASGALSSSAGAGRGSQGVGDTINSIGEIKVYTQATDAQGIARDLVGALDAQFPSQANTGLN